MVVRGEAIALPLDKLPHIYIKGITGAGKTTLLSELGASLIWRGANIGVIEPGDLSYLILRRLVATGFYERFPNAFERYKYLNVPEAEKRDLFLPLNILSGQYKPHTRADIILKSYKHAWPALQDGTATNIELLVRMGALVLASNNLPLLPYLEYLYTDATFQRQLLANTDDASVQQWFKTLQLQPKGGYIPEIALTTLKRTYALSFHPVGRYAIAQRGNLLDINDILSRGQSFALNLRLADDEVSKLLGCLITVQAETVAKSRERLSAEEQNYPFVLMIDEVQRYVEKAGQLFPTMFAESRKSKISLIVANQFDAQLPEELHGSLSLCNVIIVFKSKSDSATNAVEQIGFPYNPYWVKQETGNPFSLEGTHKHYFSPQEQKDIYADWIKSLESWQAYIRLPNNAIRKMETIEPENAVDEKRMQELNKRVQEIEDEYLRLYFRPKVEIDREIEETLARFGASPVKQLDGGQSETQKEEVHRRTTPATATPTTIPAPKRNVKPKAGIKAKSPAVQPKDTQAGVQYDTTELERPEDERDVW